MTADEEFIQDFHRDGTEARLHCGAGGCGIDIVVGDDLPALRLEVLHQPRDRDGLPWGLARRLWESRVPMAPRGDGACGHVEFPQALGPRVLRECHFRITFASPPS